MKSTPIMKKIIIFVIGMLLTLPSIAQTIVKPGDKFTETTEATEDGEMKVIFLKEINTNLDDTFPKAPYNIAKEWAHENYGRDHFYSNCRYDEKNREISIKSRVELILPPDQYDVRQKVMMRYKLNCFIVGDKCVMEVKDIEYIHDNFKSIPSIRARVAKAYLIISDNAIAEHDAVKEQKINTKKSTLYFLNQLANELEQRFGNQKLMDN